MNRVLNRNQDVTGIETRPNTSNGLWAAFILPPAIIVSVFKHPVDSTLLFKQSALFSFGLFLTSLILVNQFTKTKNVQDFSKSYIISGILTAALYGTFFDKGILFSCCSGFGASIFFYKIYVYILYHFPRSFTLGEAIIVTQAFLLYLFSTFISIVEAISKPPATSLQIATLIIQVGLGTLCIICYLSYTFKCFQKPGPFYFMSSITIVFSLLIPLHVLLKRSPLLWILYVLFGDVETVKLVVYWTVCTVVGIFTISRQIRGARKASTAVRKTFHILVVAVFLPGLFYECCLLYLASGVVLGLFIALELLRILNLPPLGVHLQDSFFVFCDEKDAGTIALTPLYLLVGCSLPIWIHPAPCDMTNSAGFNLLPLLSGLLSIGIGDTSASCVGSYIGRHRWSGTEKTIEGTVGCIVSQAIAVYILLYFGLIGQQDDFLVKVTVGIVISSLVEAKTNQVDNLILPLIMYTILV